MLDFDFFEVLDSVTIARSRKHIQKYYDTSDIGTFPTRLKPISLRPHLTDLKSAITYNQIFEQLMLLTLTIYTPTHFILPSKMEKYAQIYEDNKVNVGFTQANREQGIRRLTAINLMKRMESSVYSFNLTLTRIKELIESTINLEVLKLLQETYLSKIKMIYIDPPYNTGNDFVYEDDFAQSTEEYLENSGQFDEDGNRMVQNTESNGRFHTDWLNMIYPRLKLAKALLTDDGVIFISIDDNELENIKKCCEEVFGESNFLANIVWKHTQQSKNDEPHFSRQYNHTLVYAKMKSSLPNFYFKRTEEDNKNYSNPDADPKGMWRSGDVRSPNYRKTLRYTITAPNGNIIQPPTNGWRWSEESLRDKISTGEIKFKSDNSGIIRKIYLCDQPGRTPENLWEGQQFGTTRQAASLIKNLFDGVQVFDTPKPIELIKKMLEIATGQDSIVLDFFSGSATTAHAVIQLNAEDGGHRKFIMVQLPEKTDEKSEAYKFGYKYINEIGKERIRRAAKKIAEENPETKFDGGFRVLKCDSSNMKNVYYNPAEYEPSLFTSLEDNIKEDRTSEDLLFQVMLDLGVLLSSKIEETTIAGKRVFNVEDNYLIACFDDNVTEEVITEIAKQKPYYFVMRDSSMANDSVATNFEQIFAAYSPDTVRKVL